MDWKDAVANLLAGEHYKIEPGITRILRLLRTDGDENAPAEPVKLLEVNENTIATGIQPLQFGPAKARGITCSSIIIEVTPDEFDQIQRGNLRLPNHWKIGVEIPKPEVAAGVT